jgi:hypothetical protein
VDHVDHNVLSWATARRMVRPFDEHILPLVYSKIAQSVLFFFLCGSEATVDLRLTATLCTCLFAGSGMPLVLLSVCRWGTRWQLNTIYVKYSMWHVEQVSTWAGLAQHIAPSSTITSSHRCSHHCRFIQGVVALSTSSTIASYHSIVYVLVMARHRSLRRCGL